MSEDQFINCICAAIANGWRISEAEALPHARQAYHDFGMETGFLPFGYPSYAWDEDAARVIADEFCLRFGDVA